MARLDKGMGSIDNTTHTQEDCVESDVSTLKLFAQERSDQDSIRVAGGASSLIRNTGVKDVWRYCTIKNLLSDVQVMLSQTVCTAYIQEEKKSLRKPEAACIKGRSPN
eukprot:1141909-Pelagomonas_calceolata.AAC.1